MALRGRPTSYEERFTDASQYLMTCGRSQKKLPTVEGYALFLHVHRDTLYEWAKLHPDFSDTLEEISHLQKEQLINDGIYGGKDVNSTIVKLLLQNNHDMREKTDTDLTVDSPIILVGKGKVQEEESDEE
jgi:DNA-packaging protein gp3